MDPEEQHIVPCRKMPPKTHKKKSRKAQRKQFSEVPHRRGAPTKIGTRMATSLRETVPIFPISTFRSDIMYYESKLSNTGASGVIQKYVFSANGMFDPNITGTGHQPTGFDQMMLFYEHAVVVRSRIKVTFQSTASTMCRCSIAIMPDTTTPTIEETIENGLVVTTVVHGSTTAPGTHHQIKTLEHQVDVARYFGRSHKELIASPEFYTTAAANPTEQVYFMILTWDAIGTTTYATGFDVILSYDAYFYEPRKVAISDAFTHPSIAKIVEDDDEEKKTGGKAPYAGMFSLQRFIQRPNHR